MIACKSRKVQAVKIKHGGQMKLPCIAALILINTASAWTNLVVRNNSDSGSGSLRQAIIEANSLSGSIITFRSVSGTIALQTTLPALTANMTILGPGAAQLTVISTGGAVFTNSSG